MDGTGVSIPDCILCGVQLKRVGWGDIDDALKILSLAARCYRFEIRQHEGVDDSPVYDVVHIRYGMAEFLNIQRRYGAAVQMVCSAAGLLVCGPGVMACKPMTCINRAIRLGLTSWPASFSQSVMRR